MIIVLTIANMIIGVSFVILAVAAAYLWRHRRTDWPKAWALILVGLGIGSCGVARLAHAYTLSLFPNVSLIPMAVADCLTAAMAMALTLFVPRAVYQLRLMPTLKEIRRVMETEAAVKQTARQAHIVAQRNEILTRQTALLLALIKVTPTLPDALKAQVDQLVEDIRNADAMPDSIPIATGRRG